MFPCQYTLQNIANDTHILLDIFIGNYFKVTIQAIYYPTNLIQDIRYSKHNIAYE